MDDTQPTAAVLGGSVSGLAAATGLRRFADVDRVTVYERQEYDEKRVDCGEAINDATLVPLEKTPENGFVNDVDGFQLRVYEGTDRPRDAGPLATSNVRCEPGYVCERPVVERRWAAELEARGVEFRTGRSVSPDEYADIVESYDYVVDATGQPSLTLKASGETREYTGDMVALNATVEGDFSAYANWPRIFFEGYVGYAWAFPKSDRHANVGIGWAGDRRPDDYFGALEAAAERNSFPVPDRADVNIATIPRGPSLDPARTYDPERNVFLVGDAAGIANRYQGEGICQGIRSAYLLATLIADGNESAYPRKLYELMRSEYRLARLMRGAWVEHENPELLASVAASLEGLTIDDVTRRPATVLRRVARRPATAIELFADAGMLRRLYGAYTDSWEYVA
ncbi:NAD(P)/FAD-dependent oxidoreductase [Haloterrigena sp. SYSU A121-1]|uniref:NAD(P)/FAD-dependent oxidoreductase n=1 Tax=Haloterrigena gelatinilytica TaxID=2741724 RepID=A0A8J8KDP1_9EURY|nr:NAD(P)/FAD-dependent oxidoreductase [Haloterrigena gelatinilytica]NUB93730.1 NAD(P)/FAD-dependent oxidoreductase [Haloterrigena gelatinilytica]